MNVLTVGSLKERSLRETQRYLGRSLSSAATWLGGTEQVPSLYQGLDFPKKKGLDLWPNNLRVDSHQGNRDPISIMDYFEITESNPLTSETKNPKWKPPNSHSSALPTSRRPSQQTRLPEKEAPSPASALVADTQPISPGLGGAFCLCFWSLVEWKGQRERFRPDSDRPRRRQSHLCPSSRWRWVAPSPLEHSSGRARNRETTPLSRPRFGSRRPPPPRRLPKQLYLLRHATPGSHLRHPSPTDTAILSPPSRRDTPPFYTRGARMWRDKTRNSRGQWRTQSVSGRGYVSKVLPQHL